MRIKIINPNGVFIKKYDISNSPIVARHIPKNTILDLMDDWDFKVSKFYKVKYITEKESVYHGGIFIGYVDKVDAEIVEDETNMNILTNEEKGFLINCIMSAASEPFTSCIRFNNKYDSNSGIKYNTIPKSKIIKLLEKLGGDEDDLEELLKGMTN